MRKCVSNFTFLLTIACLSIVSFGMPVYAQHCDYCPNMPYSCEVLKSNGVAFAHKLSQQGIATPISSHICQCTPKVTDIKALCSICQQKFSDFKKQKQLKTHQLPISHLFLL